ncbi:MAG: phosphate ABC transporter substrate-binding protein [Planctomycetota bacterium]
MKMLRLLCLTALAGLLLTTPFAGADEDELVLDGSTTVGPLAKAFAEHFMDENSDVNVTVSESGSGNGAKGLINGSCDIGMMSRFMKDGEFEAAVDEGVMPIAHVVALDAIAPVVHPANPVSDLSLDQLRDIYSGEITNWKEVDGPDREIVVVSRDTNSGTYGVWGNIVLRGDDIANRAEYVGSNGAVRQRVQETRGAIGYVGLGFVDDTLKDVKVGGVTPNPGNAASGKYPIARPLYMFTNGYPKIGSPLHTFLSIHLTETGQEMVEGVGYVPITQY